ncbi:aldo/keto reductase [Candidatus Villigracilis affinis]|uniref:aldo/keto reductase n=1 Tax=Candidatus Villigracilis affinis TaxID=3140682 RepID=UPI001DBD7F16|nr:aldo/keto reductase [Anaerolineales bacterium]
MITTNSLQRTLGRSGLQVSAMGLGCWAIGGPWKWLDGQGGWGDIDDNESIRAIHAALDLGVNFFDTAANYGTGHSERILGRALAGKRDKAVIATKFGFVVDEANKQVTMRKDDHLQYVRQECEDSLKRLNIDAIDLYQLHVWDYPIEKVPAMVDLLESLVKDGKIRHYGWSTDSVEGARLFAQGKHCASIQHDLNVVLDAPEMLKVCEELNLASVNRSPLARGALSGKYAKGTTFPQNDVRNDEWSKDHFFAPTLNQLDAIREILTSNGRTLVQGALAWIWARSEKTIPIPGFKTVAQVDENAKAMQFGPLTAEQMKEIDSLLGR